MPLLDPIDCYSATVAEARRRFVSACDRIGLRVSSFPAQGIIDGEEALYCDVTRLGSPEAKRAAVLCSGAAGSAGLLSCAAGLAVVGGEGLKDLPRDIALVIVHAANTKGPVWPYFPPGAEGLSADPGIDWSDAVLAEAEKRFADYQAAGSFDWRSLADRRLASMAPPAWGPSVLAAIAQDQLKDMDKVCILDCRTGPGEYGEAALIPCDPKHSAARDRAERWFAANAAAAEDAIGPNAAPCGGGLGDFLKASEVTNILLEIGTYSIAGVLAGGRREAANAYPTAPKWRAHAWTAIRECLRKAYHGLQIGF